MLVCINTGYNVNPGSKIKKFREEKRSRYVKPDEMPRLLLSINEIDNIYIRASIWMLLLTGRRKVEILSLRWNQVDLVNEQIELFDTKGDKSVIRTHVHKLSTPAVKLFAKIPRTANSIYVFPGRVSDSKGNLSHIKNIDKQWHIARGRAALEDVRIHDLRRTVGSWLGGAGTDRLVIKSVMDHKSLSTTEGYVCFGEATAQKAMEGHASRLLECGSPKFAELGVVAET
jgi:integrase